jgi:hypothetical protein
MTKMQQIPFCPSPGDSTMLTRMILLLGGALAAAAPATDARAGSFLRGCAARDLQIQRMIEQYADAHAVTAARTKQAFNTLMHARTVCHEGFVMDGLALYDGIAKNMLYDLIAMSIESDPATTTFVTAAFDDTPVHDVMSQLYDRIAQSIANDPRMSAE